MSELVIVHNEIDSAISIMNEVAAWGRELGYPVWPSESLTKDALLNEDVEEANFCVGRIGSNDICSFILQWKDSEWWPEAPDYEAAYLHKFCVRREYAHQGMTKKVIQAITLECKSHGAKYIRLDTGWDKEKVKQIYLDAGFQIVKKCIRENENVMALYEIRVD